MIHHLSVEQCREMLTAASVGRVGFVQGDRVQIIPVNYVHDGDDIIIRTSPDGILRALPAATTDVAFEVDHIDSLAGTAWSVLLTCQVTEVTDPEEIAALDTHRVTPWAGPGRTLHLRLRAKAMSGRLVHRQRNT